MGYIMRIESSSLALQSTNSASSRYEKTEELRAGRLVSDNNGGQKIGMGLSISHTVIEERSFLSSYEEFKKQQPNSEIKDAADKLAKELNQTGNNPSIAPADGGSMDDMLKLSLKDKMKLFLLFQLLSNFKKDPLLRKELGLDEGEGGSVADLLVSSSGAAPNSSPPANPTPNPANGLAIDYSVHESLYQSETAQFSAAGQVKTADGKTIDINVNLTMSRETLETNDVRIRMQAATKDPLIVNFGGTAAELSNERFSFDLTADGTKDLIPKLMGSSGFLALDKNQDGTINDGTELFGARTGDGFSELAQYDDDKNGWIDENDPVFKQLAVWMNSGTESQKLVGLQEAGIGAIYNGKAATSFHVQNKNDAYENLGVLQSTGIFLKEEGGAGTIQQIDLTV
jgi:hypothetical protein